MGTEISGLAAKVIEGLGEPILGAQGFRVFESSWNSIIWPTDWIRMWRVEKRSKEQAVPKWMVLAVTASDVVLMEGSGVGKRWEVGKEVERWARGSVTCTTEEKKTRGVIVFKLTVDDRAQDKSGTVEIEASTSDREATENMVRLLGDPQAS